MNCREFDLLVIDWVRGVELDGQARHAAETHAAACVRCRDRLAGERALTASFEQLAQSTVASESPANVEETLRAAFREQIAATQPLQARWHLKVGGHLKSRWPLTARPQLGRVAWSGAAAAMVIAGVLLWVSRDRGASPTETRPAIVDTAPASGQPSGEQPGAEQTANGQQRVVASQPETPSRAKPPASPAPSPAARRGDPELATAPSQRETTLMDPAGAHAPMVREVTTEFLPFPYAEGLSAGERVQLIHVRLPGEALTFFGLPPAADPSATVPADVLLGQDGTARAVRFVRFTASTSGSAGGASRY